jgi:hypothetical protein
MYNGVMSVEGIWVNAILCTFYVYKFAFEYSIHKKNDLLLALSNEISQNLAISHIYRLYHVIFDDQIKTRLIKVLAFVSTAGVQSQLLEYNFCLRHMWENLTPSFTICFLYRLMMSTIGFPLLNQSQQQKHHQSLWYVHIFCERHTYYLLKIISPSLFDILYSYTTYRIQFL